METKDGVVMLVGLAQNAANGLRRLWQAVKCTRQLGVTIRVRILENGSTDRTVDVLHEWKASDPNMNYQCLDIRLPQSREIRLGTLRNRLWTESQYDPDWDTLMMVDCDLKRYWSPEVLKDLLADPSWTVLTAYGSCPLYSYSDIYAYRTAAYPNGPLQVSDYWRRQVPAQRRSPPHDQRRESVLSAFGWLGLYRRGPYMRRALYGLNGDCEHVGLHADIRKQGITILTEPRLKVMHP